MRVLSWIMIAWGASLALLLLLLWLSAERRDRATRKREQRELRRSAERAGGAE